MCTMQKTQGKISNKSLSKELRTKAQPKSTAAINVTGRSESIKFASLSDLPPGMANLLRPEMDAKHQLACSEIARLDEILKEAAMKERKVKRDRAVLEMKLTHELDEMKAAANAKSSDCDEQENTAKFLALMHCDIREQQRSAESLDLLQPLFQTECPDVDIANSDTELTAGCEEFKGGRPRTAEVVGASRKPLPALTGGKDFVQRNILIAAHPGGASSSAMTPDDQARLDDLLRDLDDTRDRLPEEEDDSADEVGQLQFGRRTGCDDLEAHQRLMDIEAKLAALNPSLSAGGGSSTKVSSAVPGDRALASQREDRMMAKRLGEIEARLMTD